MDFLIVNVPPKPFQELDCHDLTASERGGRALSMATCDWDIDAAIAFEESLLYSENGPPAELAFVPEDFLDNEAQEASHQYAGSSGGSYQASSPQGIASISSNQ